MTELPPDCLKPFLLIHQSITLIPLYIETAEDTEICISIAKAQALSEMLLETRRDDHEKLDFFAAA